MPPLNSPGNGILKSNCNSSNTKGRKLIKKDVWNIHEANVFLSIFMEWHLEMDVLLINFNFIRFRIYLMFWWNVSSRCKFLDPICFKLGLSKIINKIEENTLLVAFIKFTISQYMNVSIIHHESPKLKTFVQLFLLPVVSGMPNIRYNDDPVNDVHTNFSQ